MSLINEALKKAEQARAGGLSETPAPPLAPVIAKRGRAIGTRTLVVLGLLLAVLVVGGVALLLLPSGSAPAPGGENVAKTKTPAETKSATVERSAIAQTTAPAPASKPAPSAKAATPSSAPTATGVPAKNSSPADTPPANATATPPAVAPPAQPPAAPVVSANSAVAPVPVAPAAMPAPTAASPNPAAAAVAPVSPSPPATSTTPNATLQPDERIALHLDRLRILGVRSPGPEARVLIGERVYRINDVVDRALGLRLQSVEPGKITFVDAAGVTYTKNY